MYTRVIHNTFLTALTISRGDVRDGPKVVNKEGPPGLPRGP